MLADVERHVVAARAGGVERALVVELERHRIDDELVGGPELELEARGHLDGDACARVRREPRGVSRLELNGSWKRACRTCRLPAAERQGPWKDEDQNDDTNRNQERATSVASGAHELMLAWLHYVFGGWLCQRICVIFHVPSNLPRNM